MILNMVMAEEDINGGIDGYVKLTLMRGCDDYVMAAEIVDNIFNIDECFKKYIDPRILAIVSKTKEINDKMMNFEIAKELSIAIIKNVLTKRLMEIGDLEDEFVKWPLDSKGAIWLVNREWDLLDKELPGLGLYWLNNTKSGTEIGESSLAYWNLKKRGIET